MNARTTFDDVEAMSFEGSRLAYIKPIGAEATGRIGKL